MPEIAEFELDPSFLGRAESELGYRVVKCEVMTRDLWFTVEGLRDGRSFAFGIPAYLWDGNDDDGRLQWLHRVIDDSLRRMSGKGWSMPIEIVVRHNRNLLK